MRENHLPFSFPPSAEPLPSSFTVPSYANMLFLPLSSSTLAFNFSLGFSRWDMTATLSPDYVITLHRPFLCRAASNYRLSRPWRSCGLVNGRWNGTILPAKYSLWFRGLRWFLVACFHYESRGSAWANVSCRFSSVECILLIKIKLLRIVDFNPFIINTSK